MTLIHRKSMRLVALSFSLLGAAGAAAGCTSTDDAAGGPDAGAPDVATLDGGGGGAPDAGQPQGSDPDAGPVASYKIGGTVAGLHGGGLVLEDNGGDPLPIAADGAFTFAAPIADGAHYFVRVRTQPTSPAQSCTAANGAGVVAGHDVTEIAVTCVDHTVVLGGNAVGLKGSGLVLHNEGGDDLLVKNDGLFHFATQLPMSTPYAVTIKTQPSSPTQTCSVSGGTGTTGASDIWSVVVNCDVNAYTLGGTVTGLASSVVVQDEGGNDLTLSANGTYAFPVPRKSGTPYAVAVKTQPSGPTQVCTVTNAAGTIMNANVSNVNIACQTQSFTIGGTYPAAVNYPITLQNNGGDDIQVTGQHTTFTFPTPVPSGTSYHVTMTTKAPLYASHCYLSNESGVVTNANVTSVLLTCPDAKTWTTVAPMPTPRGAASATLGQDGRIYVVGGWAGGLASTALEIYSPDFNTWTAAAPLPSPRAYPAAVTAPDGRIFVIGGSGTTVVRTVDVYSPTTNTWSTAASLLDDLELLGASIGSDGRIYAFSKGHTEAYTIATNTWTTVAGNRTNWLNLRGALNTSDGRIYSVGEGVIESLAPGSDAWVAGPTHASNASFIGFGLYNELYMVGVGMDKWAPGDSVIVAMPPPSAPHGEGAGVVMPHPDGRVFAFGGFSAQRDAIGTTEVYTP
jgi:Kelch motif